MIFLAQYLIVSTSFNDTTNVSSEREPSYKKMKPTLKSSRNRSWLLKTLSLLPGTRSRMQEDTSKQNALFMLQLSKVLAYLLIVSIYTRYSASRSPHKPVDSRVLGRIAISPIMATI